MGNALNSQDASSFALGDGQFESSEQVSSRGDDVHDKNPSPPVGVFGELLNGLVSARATFLGFLELIALETRRAGLTLVWMLTFGTIAAICVVSAWLGLMAALVLWATALGLPLIGAIIAVAAFNCLAAAVLIRICFSMSRDLLFSATRRQLAGELPVDPTES